MNNPVEILKSVVALAEERQALGHLITRARRIDESDTETVKRLMSDREWVVKFMRKAGIRREPFDHDYKQDFKGYFVAFLKGVATGQFKIEGGE